jgi:hypothetical protein
MEVPFCDCSSMPGWLLWGAVGPGADVGCCTDLLRSMSLVCEIVLSVIGYIVVEPPLTTTIKCLHSGVDTLIISHFNMINPFKVQWLLYVPPGLTFPNSTFCPHIVFICFVWISEQTAIISLYSVNWLVCITETECVYCAVRSVSLGCFLPLRLVVGLSPWRPTFDPRSVTVRFVMDKVALGHVFLRVVSGLPCQHNSANAPYWSSATCFSYQKDKRAKSVDLPNRNAVSEIGELWTEK